MEKESSSTRSTSSSSSDNPSRIPMLKEVEMIRAGNIDDDFAQVAAQFNQGSSVFAQTQVTPSPLEVQTDESKGTQLNTEISPSKGNLEITLASGPALEVEVTIVTERKES
ncbi:hypothetical protein PTKIN_Ptkin03bG0122700 [Pterospermum kingtungense]